MNVYAMRERNTTCVKSKMQLRRQIPIGNNSHIFYKSLFLSFNFNNFS